LPSVELKLLTTAALLTAASCLAQPPSIDPLKAMDGFDGYMAKVLKDWNGVGVGVAVVSGDKLVFAKGYGYPDYGNKLPFTPRTMVQIASNTKLFTAVSAGMLVEEGKLSWDAPVRDSVPSIKFYDDKLSSSVTLRDMLSHRTGITRHDTIWFQSDFTRKQLYERLVYLEPQVPIRTLFLYNNLMYVATGYMIELQSGRKWEQFVRSRILDPLDMKSTAFTVDDLKKSPEPSILYNERRDSFDLYNIPHYEDQEAVGPAGAIVSNIEDVSHWLITLMNDGKYQGKQVLPMAALKETLKPAIPVDNEATRKLGWLEIVNPQYCLGRQTLGYRGRLLTLHGGDLPGIHTQVSFLPEEKLGVLVFVIGDHMASMYNGITYNVYERLLGMSETPWSERYLKLHLAAKKSGTEARSKAGAARVPDTKPSHALTDYAGEYRNAAYGVLKIGLKSDQLQFDFHKIQGPLTHYHYDRFDTEDFERFGKFSLNFRTNPQGDIDQTVISLDEAEVTFTKTPEAIDPKIFEQLSGSYMTPSGIPLEIAVRDGKLSLTSGRVRPLVQTKGLQFRIASFSDVVFEFVTDGGKVTGLKIRDPSGEVTYPKKP
jgi:CubicO group peptidase (beta-lactamase class C family)